MEMVAASKMRKAQERGLAGRAYSDKMVEVIADLTRATKASGGSAPHPLLDLRTEIKKIALVFVSPDRGMCGGLISISTAKLAIFL
jgi:F-type H+-transporting ATPase subunit gamma